MIDFIANNVALVSLACGIVGDLALTIFLLLRKRKDVAEQYVDHLIDESLPSLIRLAEETDCDGIYKLSFVVESVLKKIKRYIKKHDAAFYRSLIISKVEDILSTPQKKEN